MRKQFIFALSLVLGLSMLTASFAFTFSDGASLKQQNEFYLRSGLSDPQTDWTNPASWEENPSSTPSCSPGDHPCRITLSEGIDLESYLQGLVAANVEYQDLVDQPEITPRATMP